VSVPETPARGLGGFEHSPRTLREALPIFLRHGSPRILLLLVGIVLVGRVRAGGFSLFDFMAAAVVFLYWPTQEWLIHVFVLHAKPFVLLGRTFDLPVPRSHRAHHQDPWNYRILFIPLHTYLYTLPVLFLLCFGLAPTRALALSALLTHLALTLHYEAVHFLVHTRVVPRTPYYQRLWRNHRLHHFRNEHFWYGVTRLGGDRLFGTAPNAASVAVSPTARTHQES
jgi:Fatty acid hydroxylase